MQRQAHIGLLYFVKKREIVYFASFGVEYIPEEIKEFVKEFPGNKNIKTNIFRVQKRQFNNVWILLHRIY